MVTDNRIPINIGLHGLCNTQKNAFLKTLPHLCILPNERVKSVRDPPSITYPLEKRHPQEREAGKARAKGDSLAPGTPVGHVKDHKPALPDHAAPATPPLHAYPSHHNKSIQVKASE